jgi:aminopeptidase
MSIIDPRVTQLAEILVDYSMQVKNGDKVYILSDSVLAGPLFQEVYRLVIQRGGDPYPHMALDPHIGPGALDRIFMIHASEEQLRGLSEVTLAEMRAMDCYIRIGAPEGATDLTGIDPKRIAMRQKATEAISEERRKKRWVLTRYPTEALAENAGMSLDEYRDFFFGVTNVNYDEMRGEGERLANVFNQGKVVRIEAPGTDLTLSIEGRKAMLWYGKKNVPDGEFCFGPVEDSVNGIVKFTYPAIKDGQEVDGVGLEFKQGVVVQGTAEKNQGMLNAMLDTDQGARRAGELGFGTNYRITRFTKNIIFDEKIGGTIHLAVGAGYPESGSKNKSGIHWDMLVDMRPHVGGGRILLDGRTVQENGKFLI